MLSLEEVKAYGPQYKTVPVSRRMYADIRTPVEVMRILKTVSSQCYLLESMEDSKRWGRWGRGGALLSRILPCLSLPLATDSHC